MVYALVVWLVIWELAGRAGLSTVVPPFSRVITTGMSVVWSEKFATAAMISLRSFAIGMACALAVGIPLGFLMARVRLMGRIFTA